MIINVNSVDIIILKVLNYKNCKQKKVDFMKRTNYRRRLFSYIFISCVFLSSFLFYSPADIVLSAQSDPYLEMLSPSEVTVFDNAMVEITGNISDDSTPPEQLSLRVYEKLDSSSDPIEITSEGQLTFSFDAQKGNWVYSKQFNDGIHSIIFVLMDAEGNSVEKSMTIIVNKEVNKEQKTVVEKQNTIVEEAPVSASVAVGIPTEINDEVGPRPTIVDVKIIPDGITDERKYLSAEDMTQVPLNSKIMVVIRETGTLTYTQPLLISSSKGEIKSKEDQEGIIPKRNKDGDYVIIFTPLVQLDPSTTYYVYVNPSITNELGNRIYPKFFKFTTTNVYHIGDIHGNYANNTNACAYCHSTHNGETPTLEGGKYGASEDNFCMVCHDGTNGSPMPDKYNSTNKHNQHVAADAKNSESCTSCHNPHASWTAENPARVQSVQPMGASHFQTLTYKKAGTATGKAEDFTLCLNCHDGKKASNIKQYYEDETIIAESGHNITAKDGSGLDGQFTCADCHETHGSNNIMLLRESLGNVKVADSDKFQFKGTAWDAINERQFCLKCHNNTTEVYGSTSTFKERNGADQLILGHQATDIEGCSTCHGGANQSMIEAAHGPKKIDPVSKQENP
jgi:hypothetical protein